LSVTHTHTHTHTGIYIGDGRTDGRIDRSDGAHFLCDFNFPSRFLNTAFKGNFGVVVMLYFLSTATTFSAEQCAGSLAL
jgi:hypothetical protein